MCKGSNILITSARSKRLLVWHYTILMNFLKNDTVTNNAADPVSEQSPDNNDESSEGEEEDPSGIADLHWGGPRFCNDPHVCCGCDELDSPGQQTCQYNALCDGNCGSVLSIQTQIYVLERCARSIAVCQWCFENMVGAMKDEGGWTVDDESFTKGHEFWGESDNDTDTDTEKQRKKKTRVEDNNNDGDGGDELLLPSGQEQDDAIET